MNLKLFKYLPNLRSKNYLSHNERYCIEIVKKFDYENYLATLFIKNDLIRKTAFTLRAFNVELSLVRDMAKTDQMAHLRFQFWNSIVQEIYSDNFEPKIFAKKYDNIPLALGLSDILSDRKLSKHWLVKLIEIRDNPKYLGSFPFNTLEELEKYAESSIVSLYYLINEEIISLSSNQTSSSHHLNLDHLANHLGKAQGLINTLRGVRHNSKNRRCYIPTDVLVETKSSHESFLQCSSDDPNLIEAVYTIASRSNEHLIQAKELFEKLSRSDRSVYFSLYISQFYLDDLQRYSFNIFHPILHSRNGLIPWKLWWRSKFYV
ncbi:Squalene/phytoene synthase-like protein [Sarcoptes scabiei]|uniref:Squalene/phytoene synthase-like protein n=1 Tax=Sarcoptes scabiei TaxID=52283 RepID=A0A132AJR2_SARSC|nr:Squalene/phytoene synthase-like protein [Sarcoptes scabiei]